MQRDPYSPLQTDVHRDGVIATATVTGELDLATAPGLVERLLTVAAADSDRPVLDLTALSLAMWRALDQTYTLLPAVCPVILRAPRRAFMIAGISWRPAR